MLLHLEKEILAGQSWESQMDMAGVAMATPPKKTVTLLSLFQLYSKCHSK